MSAIALVIACRPAAAAVVEGLYESSVTVEDRGPESRQQGLREALGRVLIRMTGRRTASADPDLAPLLERAERFALQYGYTAEDELRAVFDGAALERGLAELGQPIWGSERPLTLLWLAIDRGAGQRGVLGAASEEDEPDPALEETREFLQEIARERGLPLRLPLLDAEDYAALTFADICGGFDDKILAASARYNADAVLVGCARPGAGDRFSVRWTLRQASGPSYWHGGIEEGLQRAADAFARDFATAGTQASSELEIVVGGVESFDDYGRVLAFLRRSNAIRQVGIERIEGTTVVFGVLSREEPTRLRPALTIGNVLEATTPPLGQPTPSQALYFRLLRP